MKALVLTLALGLGYIAQDLNGERASGQQTKTLKRWNTVYLVANKPKMIGENGPLRIYLRSTEKLFNRDLNITFYLRVNCTCQKFSLHASKTEDIWYSMSYSGISYFYFIENLKKAYAIFLVNISKDGQVTSMMSAFAPVPEQDLIPEDYKLFEDNIREMKVPLKNIIKIRDTGAKGFPTLGHPRGALALPGPP